MATVKVESSNEPLESVDTDAFVGAMRVQAAAVNLVTSNGPGGRTGVTVSAMTSVSAEPPLLLACVNRRSPSVAIIRQNGVFCINALSAEQSELANTFAGRPSSGEPFDFAAADWINITTAAPALVDAVANLDCVIHDIVEAGSHTIFIGRVVGASHRNVKPLVYCDRTYLAPGPLED
ncbi:flavin reductase family protein [Dongia rigui]|uniref:Flavin reductase family protein n=1 Tax=Dongia rigui TaxID=940149 RepID=A0ABU5E094_9PROT|nr:flavin reductase family protein [Dongia rigui]MDY0872993.1 flavin reductase family protein [Dongia rigui]